MSQLRRVLPADSILTRSGGYVLAGADTDAAAFERLVGEAVGPDPERAAALLEQALALWRGPALVDFRYEDWAQPEIGRLEELRLAAVEERIEAQLALGRHRLLVPELEALLAEHPLRERLRGQLMVALYGSGRQAEALEVYRQGRERLVEELGLEPSPFLERLEKQILTHDPELAPPVRRLAVPPALARRGRALVVVGAVLLAGAIAAGAWELTSGSSAAPGASAVVLFRNGQPAARIVLERTPSQIAAGGGAVWVTDADDGTVSRIDARRLRLVATAAVGSTPTAEAFGAGALWLANGRVASPGSQLIGQAFPDSVSRLDADSGVVTLTRTLPRRGVSYNPVRGTGALAVTDGAVWAIGADQSVLRLDSTDGRVVATIRDLAAVAIAASDRAVWVDDGQSTLTRIDPVTNRVAAKIQLGASGLGGIALGDGAVWVADPQDGTVWRVDTEPSLVTRTVTVGIGVTSVAFAGDSVWAGNAFEGTVSRIDPATNTVARTFDVGGAPQTIAASGGDVWVAVAGVPPPGPRVAGVESLPSGQCGPVVAGGGKARVLIASDLPLTGAAATATVPMTRAIELVLQQHRFLAGKYTVAYQSCDDATAQAGNADFATCGANAKSYARDRDVLGVIGPYTSDCASVEIPILNLARGSPVAQIGVLATNVALTHRGPATASNFLSLLYPTGLRNFARIIAPDDLEGASHALLAKQLGLRRLATISDGSEFARTLDAGFTSAARKLGLRIVDTEHWDVGVVDQGALAARVAKAHPEGVLIGGFTGPPAGRLLRALRARLGPRVALFAGDGFLTIPYTLQQAGRSLIGLYLSFAGRANERLPAAGQTFVRTFAATQPSRRVVSYSAAYGAQAAEVLLAAIARSDGTRASVLRELFREHVRGGILGDFSFTSEGDMTPSPVTIFRVVGGKRPSSTGERDFQGSVVDRVVDVPASLAR